jgi:hypothetical protein
MPRRLPVGHFLFLGLARRFFLPARRWILFPSTAGNGHYRGTTPGAMVATLRFLPERRNDVQGGHPFASSSAFTIKVAPSPQPRAHSVVRVGERTRR